MRTVGMPWPAWFSQDQEKKAALRSVRRELAAARRLGGWEVDADRRRMCPLQESNLHLTLRRGSFYPLN
jgi:hypothetical protein